MTASWVHEHFHSQHISSSSAGALLLNAFTARNGSATNAVRLQRASLQSATRCHNNFIEDVPLALLLASVVELNGGNRKVLNSALSALLLLRILHVEFGLLGPKNNALRRPVGYFGTQGYMAGMAGYAAYLVKGYWGLKVGVVDIFDLEANVEVSERNRRYTRRVFRVQANSLIEDCLSVNAILSFRLNLTHPSNFQPSFNCCYYFPTNPQLSQGGQAW